MLPVFVIYYEQKKKSKQMVEEHVLEYRFIIDNNNQMGTIYH